MRLKVHCCAICRTDLHIIEGDLPLQKKPIILGHQIVGVIDSLGENCKRLKIGTRIGVAWLRHTCGKCRFCTSGRENLIRGVSLFHVFLPIILIWMVHRLGYDRRALATQTIFGWIILVLTYLLTKPADNINWGFGPGNKPQHAMPPLAYLAVVMIFFPLVIYLPTDWLLRRLF